MKKTLFTKLASAFLGALITLNTLPLAVYAVKNDSFDSEDSLRQKIISYSKGERKGNFFKNTPFLSNYNERYIVGFKSHIPLAEIKKALNGYSYRLLADSNERIFLVYAEKEFLSENKDIIDFFEKDEEKELFAFYPNDTYSSAYELEALKMYDVWEHGFGSPDVTIAILDSGVDRFHEDLLEAEILPGFDYETGKSGVNHDPTGHGTKVTGIISATNDNSVGCCGIAPNCTVLPLKITDANGKIYTSDFIDSLYMAADSGADIINMSLGSYERLEGEEKAIKYAQSKGCILIAASGNEGNHHELAGKECFPASYDGVISVGAVDETGKSCVFSQHNDKVDISAPGSGLSLLQSGGGYTTDSGTSFSSAYVSGIAALALSQLDEGIEMNSEQFDYLITEHASGTASKELGAGIITPDKVISFANYPLVSGIENKKVYYDNVTISFNRGTAILDGEEFKSGSLCKHTGEHILTIADGDKVSVVQFTTDNLPLSCSLKEGDGYSYINFSYGSATLNGLPYFSGDKITSDGMHTLILTGPFGNRKSFDFLLSFSTPQIEGVENEGIYSTPRRISIASGGKIYLNGKETEKEFTVFEEGKHTLLIKQNGNMKVSLTFTISYNDEGNPYKYTTIDTAMSNATAVCNDDTIVIWNDINRGIRLLDKKTSKLLRYINVGENIKGIHFGKNHLYIAGTNNIFAIEKAQLRTTSIIKSVYKFKFPISASFFYDEDLYCAESSSISSGTIKKISLSDLSAIEETDISFVRSIPDVISYDPTTNCVAFGKVAEGKIYVSPISGEYVKLFSLTSKQSQKGFGFKDGKIALGGIIFDTEKEKTVFSVNDTSAFFFNGNILITENAAYDIETAEILGYHPIEFKNITFSAGIYCASFDETSLYISKELPYAYCPQIPTSKGNSFGFTDHIHLSKEYFKPLLLEERIYAVGTQNTLYVFDKEMKYLSTSYLSFVPTDIATDGEYVYLYSSDSYYFAVYSPKDETISYFDAPCKISKLYASEKYVVFVGKEKNLSQNNLYVYSKDKSLIFSNKDEDFISAVLSHDGKSLYAIYSKSFYTVLTAYNIPDFHVEYERSLEYTADDIFCDSTYLYINNAAYLSRNGNIAASCAAKIFGRTYDTFITANGLFKDGKYISNFKNPVCPFAFSDDGTLFLFHDTCVSVIKNVYGGDLGTLPEISGVVDKEVYNGSVFPKISRGIAFLDGKQIENNTEILQGGTHNLLVVLPYGLKKELTFTLNATLTELKIIGGDKAVKINDSIKLEVDFLPVGAPAEELFFYSESDVLKVTPDGVVTGVKAGEGLVYAATIDGRIFTKAKVLVLSSMLVFTPSYMGVDRTHGILYGVPSGMTVSSLINSLDISLRENAFVYDNQKEAVGIVKTGMIISLLNKEGKTIDSLRISVIGDCNGDGDVNVGDLAEATFLLTQKEADPVYVKSADFSNTGTIDVADLFTYKEIILGNEKIVSSANTTKNIFDGNLTIKYDYNTDGTVTVSVSAPISDEKIHGFSGTIKFDDEKLDFISADNIGYIHGAEIKDGEIKFLTVFKNDTLSSDDTETEEIKLLSLSFVAKSKENSVISANNLIIHTEKDKKRETKKAESISDFVILQGGNISSIKEIVPSVGTLLPDFSPNVFSYVLKIPEGTESLELRSENNLLNYSLSKDNVPTNKFEDGCIITIKAGEVEYTLTIVTENSNGSNSKTVLVITVIISIIITVLFSAFFFFIWLKKKNPKFQA